MITQPREAVGQENIQLGAEDGIGARLRLPLQAFDGAEMIIPAIEPLVGDVSYGREQIVDRIPGGLGGPEIAPRVEFGDRLDGGDGSALQLVRLSATDVFDDGCPGLLSRLGIRGRRGAKNRHDRRTDVCVRGAFHRWPSVVILRIAKRVFLGGPQLLGL